MLPKQGSDRATVCTADVASYTEFKSTASFYILGFNLLGQFSNICFSLFWFDGVKCVTH